MSILARVNSEVWNEIAQTQTLRSDWARRVFPMRSDAMLEEMNREGAALTATGLPNPVVLAYQTVAPLLLETEAISRYIAATGRWDLRNALTEVNTIGEALMVAGADIQPDSLTPPEEEQLRQLLRTALHALPTEQFLTT